MDSEVEAKRQLAVFADDLYRYLLQKRLNVEDLCPPLRRSDDPTTTFYPVVGLSILCLSHRKQEDYFKYFAKHIPVIIKEYRSLEVENYGRFCVVANDHFHSTFENVCEKIISLGCLILELSAFCDVQGFKHLKYFSANIWADMIYRKFGLEFFNNTGWNELIQFASDNVEHYIEKNYEICVDKNRTDIKTEKLREYDLWASMLSSHTLQGISTLGVEPPRLKFKPNRITPIKILHKDVLIRFLGSIIEDIDPATEEFFKLIRDLGNTIKLMNNELYLQVIVEMIKILGVKMRSFDLLQLAKLVIGDNEALATFCFLTIQYAYGYRSEQDVMNIFSIISGEPHHFSSLSPVNVKLQKNPAVKSPSKSGAISKVTGQKCVSNEVSSKRLLREFKRIVERTNDMAGKEICRYFKTEPKSHLLENIVFRKVMELTWQHVDNRWDNIWILSLMKSLEPNLKTSLDFSLSVFRNLTLLDPEILAETLMGELVKKSEIFKILEVSGAVKQEPKVKENAGEKKVPRIKEKKDISETPFQKVVECTEKYKEKRLASEKREVECPQSKDQTPKKQDKKSNLEVIKKNYNINENKILTNELMAEKYETKIVSASRFTETPCQNEQISVPQEGKKVNIPEQTELIAFPSLEEFLDQYFRAVVSSDLCNESSNSDVSTIASCEFPSGSDSILNPACAEKNMDAEENKDNIIADNSTEKANTDIPETNSSNSKVISKLEDNTIEEHAEEEDKIVVDSEKLVLVEYSDAYEKILTKLNKLDDLKTRMKTFLVQNSMQNSTTNEEETDKEVDYGMKLLDPVRELPDEIPNVQSQNYGKKLSGCHIISPEPFKAISHSEDILSSGQQDCGTSDTSLLQNLERISPDVLKTFKVKCIIDKQIKKELMKYYDRYYEIHKVNDQLSGVKVSQDKSSVQSEL